MKKRFKRMLAMALLAAMILSGGIPALAAEDPAVESELTAGIDTSDPGAVGDAEDQASDGDPEPNPLPQDVGFNLRNVSVSRIPDSDKFTVTIIHAKKIDERGRKTKYGIAEYDMTSKKAIDIEGRTTWVPHHIQGCRQNGHHSHGCPRQHDPNTSRLFQHDQARKKGRGVRDAHEECF